MRSICPAGFPLLCESLQLVVVGGHIVHTWDKTGNQDVFRMILKGGRHISTSAGNLFKFVAAERVANSSSCVLVIKTFIIELKENRYMSQFTPSITQFYIKMI